MSTQSAANNPTGQTLSQAPAIRSFEFDDNAIGEIKSSVNKFRGNVSLPLDFLTLPGHDGLETKISALYSSSIKKQIDTWNIDAPTGILGLGWDMPIESISVYKAGNGSSSSDQYFLKSNGSANPMVLTSKSNGLWNFQLRNYEFWDITYDPSTDLWTIVKENGFTYLYGGGSASQSAIKWGNWMGSSSEIFDQDQFTVAWNLTSITSPWGQSVRYTYENVEFTVGNGIPVFTQASYLKTVTDSFGRIITFHYGEKFGARSSSNPRGILEYQARNTQQSEPNAYQEVYETRFLDTIEVANDTGIELYELKFNYDFFNIADSRDPNYDLLWKRTLKSVYRRTPDGEILPGMNFTYKAINETNPGALASVTYPSGGKAKFKYKKNFIAAPKKKTMTNPLPGSIPGVWHGSDYTVFTYCLPNSEIQAYVYSWNGRWVQQDLTTASMQAIQADASSIRVQTQDDFIAISVRNLATDEDELYLYRQGDDNNAPLFQAKIDEEEHEQKEDLLKTEASFSSPTGFGNWVLYNNQAITLALKPGSKENSTFISGTDFLIASNPDYTSGQFQGFSYDWRSQLWQQPALLPSSGLGSSVALSAYDNFYLAAHYSDQQKEITYEVFYRDELGAWQNPPSWKEQGITIELIQGKAQFSIQTQPSFVATTAITGQSSGSVHTSLQIFQWDENFFVLNASSPASANLSAPSSHPTLPGNSLLNNYSENFRNVGGSQTSNQNWIQQAFTQLSPTDPLSTAVGNDAVILSQDQGGSPLNELLTFDPNFSSSTPWSNQTIAQSGSSPTARADYLTLGSDIYHRSTDGNWLLLSTGLSGLGDPNTIANLAPNYLAFQDATDSSAQSYITILKNGEALPPQQLSGGAQKIHVPSSDLVPGSTLASPRAIVSYPSGTSFKSSDSLSLYNLDDGDLGDFAYDFPVAVVEITDAYDAQLSYFQSLFYANSASSQIAYNSQTGITQYPLVTTLAGVNSTADTPPSNQPEGRSEFYYSNGLSPQSGLYPSGGLTNYQNQLNGMLLAQKDYDASNQLVHSQLNYWKVFTADPQNPGDQLFGGYVRQLQTEIIIDGVPQNLTSSFDPETGMEISRTQTYFDNSGTSKTLITEALYAHQVPAYRADFQAKHIFTSIAQSTKKVVPTTGGTPTYIGSQVTTFKNWASSQEIRLAPAEEFLWTNPGASAPSFDFTKTAQADWLLSSRTLKRSPITGITLEEEDVSGIPTSSFYDKNDRYLIARFANGSRSKNEVSYYGFQDYEKNPGWTLGAGTQIIPNAANPDIDAHTGKSSLRLDASSKGLSYSIQPARDTEPYLFTAWVKKPLGFDQSKGEAKWIITVGSTTLTLDFPNTIGEWTQITQVIDPPVGTIQIVAENQNTQSEVLVDDLRVSPLSCGFESQTYEPRSWQPIAKLGTNGESSRMTCRSFAQRGITTNAADEVSGIECQSFSRLAHQGEFNPAVPNSKLAIAAAKGGELLTFTRGAEWKTLLDDPNDTWVTKDGRLTQKNSSAAKLPILGSDYHTNFALTLNVQPLEAITAPLGIDLGKSYAIQWDPTALQWQLLDSQKTVVASGGDHPLLDIPAAPFETTLNQGSVSPELSQAFNDHGYPLPEKTTVTQQGSGDWILIAPGNLFQYHLKKSGNVIKVYQTERQWLVMVADQEILFWANGRIVLSYHAASSFDASPELFFGNHVALSRLATAISPQASVQFSDSRGNPRQAQKLADAQMTVSQVLTDQLGRAPIQTKTAYVSHADCPLLTYCSDFATIDWQSGKMTGLIDQAYPLDLGFPYSREVYDNSPIQRVVEQGSPGEDFRVGKHSSKIQYTNEQAKFFKTTTTNPDGDIAHEITDQMERILQKISLNGSETLKNETIYDDFGNARELRSPNYFSPPAGGAPLSSWVEKQSFDYAGRLTSVQSGNQTPSTSIYDKAGNLRFTQDPQGVSDGNFNYIKYDSLNRPIERGYLAGTWDQTTLQQKANQPDWPTTPATWRKKFTYDEIQVARYSIGRLTQAESNNGNTGQADVIEHFAYDISGQTTSHKQEVTSFDKGTSHEVRYQYDNIGNISEIKYPNHGACQAPTIHYRHNRLNQVEALSEDPNFSTILANYRYDAEGQPAEENLALGSTHSLTRTFDYNSPLWLRKIDQTNSQGNTLFKEELTYTHGAFPPATGYFSGIIASSTTQRTTTTSSSNFKYSYDATGRIENAQNPSNSQLDLGVTTPVSYDANGNFLKLPRGGQIRNYQYFAGTQHVEKITDAQSSTLASYQYDADGSSTRATTTAAGLSPARDLTLAYDPGTLLTTKISDATSKEQLDFLYDSQSQRVLKKSTAQEKLYLRGINTYPLCEITRTSAGDEEVYYFYGPTGMIAMRRGGQSYGLAKDHLGSIRSVIDSAGVAVATYDYSTFGELTAVTEPAPGFMPYLYTGQEYDFEVGLFNYRARFYSAELGRFLSKDPAGQFFSPYLYASNNPVLFVDPSGGISTFARVLIGIGLGIVAIGATVAAVVTAGALAPAAVAAWAGVGAAAGAAATASAVGSALLATGAAVGAGAAIGAVSGAAFGGAFYSLGTSNEDFSRDGFVQSLAIGAITGAVAGGVAQGFSIAGQGIAQAATGVTQATALEAAKAGGKALGKFALRQSLVSAGSTALGSTASTGVKAVVSNQWGLGGQDPGDLALSILGSAGLGALKGAASGAVGAGFSAKIKDPASAKWTSLSTKQKVGVAGGGGTVAVGGAFGFFYGLESSKEKS